MSHLKKNKNSLRQAANGIITENFPISGISSDFALVSGTAYFALVGLNAGDVVTNIHAHVSTASSEASSNLFVGLYDTDGTQLATSSDLTTAADTTGLKTFALSAPYTITADGAYYLAILQVNAGTGSALSRGTGTTAMLKGIGSGVRNMAGHAGLVALPTPAVYADASIGYWLSAS